MLAIIHYTNFPNTQGTNGFFSIRPHKLAFSLAIQAQATHQLITWRPLYTVMIQHLFITQQSSFFIFFFILFFNFQGQDFQAYTSRPIFPFSQGQFISHIPSRDSSVFRHYQPSPLAPSTPPTVPYHLSEPLQQLLLQDVLPLPLHPLAISSSFFFHYLTHQVLFFHSITHQVLF